MAAWVIGLVVVGLVLNAGTLGWTLWQRAGDRQRARDDAMVRRLSDAVKQPGDGELLERVLDRFMASVLPEVKEQAEVGPDTWEPEYEPPDEPVGDWTDPFIGLERPMVARLAPGQTIPGMNDDGLVPGPSVDPIDVWREQGEGAFEEWLADSMAPDRAMETNGLGAESWVDPVRLDDE